MSKMTDFTEHSVSDPVTVVTEALGNTELIVVSNRQPYSHEYEDGEITVDQAVGGLTAALDPIMQAVGGTWVAWGDGEADADVTENDRVAVPPSDPSYDLRRVWLDEKAVDGYYYGYSNRALWPLCHSDLGRTTFDRSEWEQYQRANELFADAIVDAVGPDRQESGDDSPLVWLQDYHLALAASRARSRLPDETTIASFWHIPWPSWDTFRACPQAEALLDGLLACDLLGFHTDQYCRRFLDCVEECLDASVDRTTGRIRHRGGRTTVRSFPLGIDTERQQRLVESDDAAAFWSAFAADHGLEDTRVAVGVDRLDYAKGLVERLDGIERFLETHPEWHDRFTYVGKLSESRMRVPAYRQYREQVAERVAAINDRFGTDDWQPVIQLTERLSPEALAGLYRGADLALVTSLRDGMNLVAKEYATSTDDGVLVLSELAGAHEELGEAAVSIHPNDTESIANGIATALTMPASERARRLDQLQRAVHNTDVYDWLERQIRAARSVGEGRRPPIAGETTAD